MDAQNTQNVQENQPKEKPVYRMKRRDKILLAVIFGVIGLVVFVTVGIHLYFHQPGSTYYYRGGKFAYGAEYAQYKKLVVKKGVKSIPDNLFSCCDNALSVSIPDSVTSIGKKAFYGCQRLSEITIPDSVTEIGEYAFYYCTGLTSVALNEGLVEIDKRAFSACTSLTAVVIPDGVTVVGAYAFRNTGLASVSLPSSLSSLNKSTFAECAALREITYRGTVAEWNAIEKDADWMLGSPIETIRCVDGTITIE